MTPENGDLNLTCQYLGAIAGSIKKTLGHAVLSEKTEAGRVYRIVADAAA